MEQMYCDKLVKDYKNNCEFAASVAVNHVANMEIPVFNTMSSLSKSELLDCFVSKTYIFTIISLSIISSCFSIKQRK